MTNLTQMISTLEKKAAKKDYAFAEKLYDQGTFKTPDTHTLRLSRLWFLIGQSLYAQKRHIYALHAFLTAVHLNEKNDRAHADIANSLADHLPETAAKHMRAALPHNHHFQTLTQAANIALKTDDKPLFEETLSHSPDFSELARHDNHNYFNIWTDAAFYFRQNALLPPLLEAGRGLKEEKGLQWRECLSLAALETHAAIGQSPSLDKEVSQIFWQKLYGDLPPEIDLPHKTSDLFAADRQMLKKSVSIGRKHFQDLDQTAPMSSLKVLDAGAGTGTFGQAFTQDLAAATGRKVITQGLERAAHNMLCGQGENWSYQMDAADITTFLQDTSHRFDLILDAFTTQTTDPRLHPELFALYKQSLTETGSILFILNTQLPSPQACYAQTFTRETPAMLQERLKDSGFTCRLEKIEKIVYLIAAPSD